MNLEAESMGLERSFPAVGPANVRGIEVNAYAAELARVSVWIGDIQWMRRNEFRESRDPILKPLETIECRDATLAPDGTEPAWPDADVVIGNPPEWVHWMDEPVPGYPKRPVTRDEAAAKELKGRTLTKLYNARPQWLADAHVALDAAVAAAYGWDDRISEDDAMSELLAMSLSDDVASSFRALRTRS